MIQPERVRPLNAKPVRPGDYVLYWMQAAQRADGNHALEFAVRRANALGLPLVVFFGLTPHFPEANARHYLFLLEGLSETAAALERRGLIEVETNAVVPVRAVSGKAEYAAATIRPKIHRLWGDYLVPLKTTAVKKDGLGLKFDSPPAEAFPSS